ncbi:MAG TPA: hypothetical protein VE953_14200 [Terriglobales bacterium]|nr:hypothetical protein [Terriglobales bacterium]
MTDTIAWLAMSLICAVIGGAVGVAAVHHRAHAAAERPRADRE